MRKVARELTMWLTVAVCIVSDVLLLGWAMLGISYRRHV
jgi:hypothetical protein